MKESNLFEMQSFITKAYGLNATDITAAKRGFFGETWRLRTEDSSYFVKIDYWRHHKELYRQSFHTLDFMGKKGIDFISRPVRRLEGALSCDFDGGVMGVFDFVAGENHEDYPVYRLFEKLAQIYLLDLRGLTLPREAPDTGVLDRFAELFASVARLQGAFPSAASVRTLLKARVELLTEVAHKLQTQAAICRDKAWDLRITHGDAGGNCIFHGDAMTIVDWDAPMLAPPERDAWFFIQQLGQIRSIEAALMQNGVPYRFDVNRLAYYCYRSFFYYICEYLMAFLSVDTEEEREDLAVSLEAYFSSWVMNALSAADRLPL